MAGNIRPKNDPTIQWQRTALATLDLSGKNVAIVGGTGGLGRALAQQLASRGAQVTVVGRTFRDAGVPRISFVEADLSLMTEAARVGRELPAEQLDLLVLTTGIFAAPTRQETPEGLERDMAVSYLSRLVLLHHIAPRLGTGRADTSIPARVFVMGFPGTGQSADLQDLNAERSYNGTKVHLATVAGNEALVVDAVRRYPQLDVFGLNPGLVKTDIRSNMYGGSKVREKLIETFIGLFSPTADEYAERVAPVLVTRDIAGRSGAMFGSKGQAILRSDDMTPVMAERVVDASEQLLRRVVPHAGV